MFKTDRKRKTVLAYFICICAVGFSAFFDYPPYRLFWTFFAHSPLLIVQILWSKRCIEIFAAAENRRKYLSRLKYASLAVFVALVIFSLEISFENTEVLPHWLGDVGVMIFVFSFWPILILGASALSDLPESNRKYTRGSRIAGWTISLAYIPLTMFSIDRMLKEAEEKPQD